MMESRAPDPVLVDASMARMRGLERDHQALSVVCPELGNPVAGGRLNHEPSR